MVSYKPSLNITMIISSKFCTNLKSLSCMVTVNSYLRCFEHKMINNILFLNKKLYFFLESLIPCFALSIEIMVEQRCIFLGILQNAMFMESTDLYIYGRYILFPDLRPLDCLVQFLWWSLTFSLGGGMGIIFIFMSFPFCLAVWFDFGLIRIYW